MCLYVIPVINFRLIIDPMTIIQRIVFVVSVFVQCNRNNIIIIERAYDERGFLTAGRTAGWEGGTFRGIFVFRWWVEVDISPQPASFFHPVFAFLLLFCFSGDFLFFSPRCRVLFLKPRASSPRWTEEARRDRRQVYARETYTVHIIRVHGNNNGIFRHPYATNVYYTRGVVETAVAAVEIQ